jgi:acid phosphatase type 7
MIMKLPASFHTRRNRLCDRIARQALFGAALLLAPGLPATGFAQPSPSTGSVTPVEWPALGHFRVMWMEDPAEQALVSWTTPVEGTSHAVHFDTEPRGGRLGAYARKTEALPPRKYTMRPADAGTPEGWAQNALLEKLTPATTYYFVIASDRHVSREFHFVTAPADRRPVKVIYGADSRRPPSLPEPHLNRRAVNRLIASLVEEQPEVLAFAHGGDYCSQAEWRFLSDWLSDHELTITQSGRILPIIPTRGNHEGREGSSVFEEVFFWPGRSTPYYFSTELSGRAVLLTLNTNASKAGDQRDWLEHELNRQRAEPDKWIALQYHVPAYPSVKPLENGAQQRQHWVPLFEQHQVDLVCEADDHMLKRTVPIYQDKHDPERGITYIGDGGLGVPQRVPDLTRWYLKSPGFATPAHHVHLIEFADEEIRVVAIGLDRKLLDRFALKSKLVPAAAAQ